MAHVLFRANWIAAVLGLELNHYRPCLELSLCVALACCCLAQHASHSHWATLPPTALSVPTTLYCDSHSHCTTPPPAAPRPELPPPSSLPPTVTLTLTVRHFHLLPSLSPLPPPSSLLPTVTLTLTDDTSTYCPLCPRYSLTVWHLRLLCAVFVILVLVRYILYIKVYVEYNMVYIGFN